MYVTVVIGLPSRRMILRLDIQQVAVVGAARPGKRLCNTLRRMIEFGASMVGRANTIALTVDSLRKSGAITTLIPTS